MGFIYRNRTKESLIETDHLNKPSTLLMQIVYLCRYTRARTCTPSQSFQCFLAPGLHTGTQRAQNSDYTFQDFLGIQAPSTDLGLTGHKPLLSCLSGNLSVFHQIQHIPEKYLRIFDVLIFSWSFPLLFLFKRWRKLFRLLVKRNKHRKLNWVKIIS